MILKRLTFLFLLFVAITSYSQVPETMSFQGILNDSNGDVVSDDSYTLEFELYDALTAGTKVWGPESHSAATVNGLYSVLLGGNGVPLDITNSFDSQYFLQVKVNGELLTPRIQLTTSPYAFTSRAVRGSDNVFPATGNVGIGTSSPTSKLDVTGTVTATEFSGVGTSLTALDASNISSGTLSDSRLEAIVDVGTLNTTGGINVGGTDDPGTGNLLVSGNIGIGTVSPLADLHLKGTGIILEGTATAVGYTQLGFRNENGTSDIWTISTGGNFITGGNLNFGDPNSPLMTIEPGGNLGIGTLTPASLLDVNGTITATAFNGDGSGLTNLPPTSPIWVGSGNISYTGGNVGIGNSSPTSALDVTGTVTATSFTGDGGGLTNLASSPWTLAAPDVYYNVGGGNVGIGTSTPATELDVVGNVKATTFTGSGASLTALNATNISSGTIDNLRLDPDLQDLADGTLSGSAIGTCINGANITDNTITTSKINGTIAIADGGTNASTATAARTNLGLVIGTNVQAYNLDLTDLADGSLTGSKVGTGISATNLTTGTLPDARLESTVDVTRLNTTGGLHVGGTSDPGVDNLLVDGNISAPNGTISAMGLTASEPVFSSINEFSTSDLTLVLGGGSVGIGTNSPAFKLDVAGTMGVQSSFNLTAPTTAAQLNVTAYTDGSIGPYLWLTRARGTQSTPSSVQTDDFLAGIYFVGRGGTVNDDGSSIIGYAAENWGTSNKGSYLQINTAAIGTNTPLTRMVIENDGNVGIGTDAPQATLDVETTSSSNFVVNINANYSLSTAGLVNFQQLNVNQGSITISGATTSYNAFTGSHYAQSNFEFDRGHIVVMTGNHSFQNGLDYGEPIYTVTVSTQANDPKILGTYFSEAPYEVGIKLIASVGNGDAWIVDTGEDIKVGDYLISSSIEGHAMKDTGEFEVAYIFARVAEDVDWSQVTETIDGVKHKKISIFYESFTRNHKVEMLEKKLEDLREEIEQLRKFLYQTNY